MASSSGRKRQRPEVEESRAECPFSVMHPDPNWWEKKAKKKLKKRRRHASVDSHDSRPQQPKLALQVAPFSPTGKFRDPNNNMDRHYMVQPNARWMEMTRYNSFVRK